MRSLLLLLAPAMLACARPTSVARPSGATPLAPDSADAVAAHRAWWTAFTLGDTAHLQGHTGPGLLLTLSSGRTFDRAAAIAQAATHNRDSRIRLDWADDRATLASPSLAITTSRMTESIDGTGGTYRYMTVLEPHGAGWRVVAAQSTRELSPTPRVSAAAAGPLADYAGEYRTPRGRTLRITVRDSALALIEPSGLEIRLEPVGPALFEMNVISMGNGIVRMQFTRDGSGRVTAISRVRLAGVEVFPRVP